MTDPNAPDGAARGDVADDDDAAPGGPRTMERRDADINATVERIRALAERLIARNADLARERDDLRDQIEGLTTKLTAAKAAHHTLNHDAGLAAAPPPTAPPDRQLHRLAALRDELDRYLRDHAAPDTLAGTAPDAPAHHAPPAAPDDVDPPPGHDAPDAHAADPA